MIPGTMPMIVSSGIVYATDFSEYTVGVAPPDWTVYSNIASVDIISLSGTYSGKAIEIVPANTANPVVWDKVPSADDVEILAVITSSKWKVNLAEVGVAARVGASGVTRITAAGQRSASGSRGKITAQESGVGQEVFLGTKGGWSPSVYPDWMVVRFKTDGNDVLMKWWALGDPEPGSWTLTGTQTSPIVDAAGTTGLWVYWDTAMSLGCQYFAVGLDGSSPALP